MKKLAVLFLFLPRILLAQIDMPGDDTLKKLPLFEMTNHGISRIDFYQHEIRFVIINNIDHTEVFSYGDRTEGQRVDTVYLEKPQLFDPKQIDDFDVMNYCEYRNGNKSGKEYGFYSFHELDGVLITGWNFRLRYSGHWKNGEKDGKWYYYSPNGMPERTEYWDKGVLKKTTISPE